MTPGDEEPTAHAQAIMERVLGLVRECRVVLCALERPDDPGNRRAPKLRGSLLDADERHRCGAHQDGGGCGQGARHASKPLVPMGAEWLERQARVLLQ